jgi:hypothetical protein
VPHLEMGCTGTQNRVTGYLNHRQLFLEIVPKPEVKQRHCRSLTKRGRPCALGKSVYLSQTHSVNCAGKTREEKAVCPPRDRDAREGQPRDWVHQVRLQSDHLVQLLDGGAHGRVQNVPTVPQDLVPAEKAG